MANPNIVNVTDIRGKTGVLNPTTSFAAIVSNASITDEVYKINSLVVSNIETQERTVTVDIFRDSISYRIASTIIIPANATLVVLTKENGIYLEEGDSVRIQASADNSLQAICSYEIIR